MEDGGKAQARDPHDVQLMMASKLAPIDMAKWETGARVLLDYIADRNNLEGRIEFDMPNNVSNFQSCKVNKTLSQRYQVRSTCSFAGE